VPRRSKNPMSTRLAAIRAGRLLGGLPDGGKAGQRLRGLLALQGPEHAARLRVLGEQRLLEPDGRDLRHRLPQGGRPEQGLAGQVVLAPLEPLELDLAGPRQQADQLTRGDLTGPVPSPGQDPLERARLPAPVHPLGHQAVEEPSLGLGAGHHDVGLHPVGGRQLLALQQAAGEQVQQRRVGPLQRHLPGDVAGLTEPAPGDGTPDVGAQEHLQDDVGMRHEVQVGLEQGAQPPRLQLAGVGERHVEPVEQDPDVQPFGGQGVVGQAQQLVHEMPPAARCDADGSPSAILAPMLAGMAVIGSRSTNVSTVSGTRRRRT
jgi:hypothetical protein